MAIYEIHKPIEENFLIDITAVVEKKSAACQEYRSQTALYSYENAMLGLNEFRALKCPPSVSHAEAFRFMSLRASTADIRS